MTDPEGWTIGGERLPLPDGAVHLWLCEPEVVRDPALLARYAALAAPHEREEEARFYFTRDRHRHRVTRALLREVIARYLPVNGEVLHFARGEHGRPELAGLGEPPPLRFNLSHTEGLAVLAVARNGELGADAEDAERTGDLVGSADAFFSPREISDLYDLPMDARRARFFELWVLKEAYLKARGTGLHLPLDSFTFRLDGAGRIAFSANRNVDPAPADWTFGLLAPTPRHRAAVAWRTPERRPLEVVVRRTVPLMMEERVPCPVLAIS